MEEKAKNWIVDIVPITRIALSRQQFFSYLNPKEVAPGSLVSIEFFRRNISGITLKNRKDFERFGNITLKKIQKVEEEALLTDKQIELAKFVSEYYFCPLGTVLKFFVPKTVKKRRSKNEELRRNSKDKKINLTQEQQEAIDKITKNWKLEIGNWKFLLFGPSSSGKTEIYINAIKKLKAKNKNLQFLILLPELILTPQAIERYGEYFSEDETVLVHSKLSKGELYENWKKVKSGKAKIIIGSRMSVFFPFKNLGAIFVDEEQDMSFKQWSMNPRYDARKVAEKLAEIHGAKMVSGSATPSVESYQKALDGEYELLKIGDLQICDTGQATCNRKKVELVDMRKEYWKRKSPALISEKLKSEIEYNLKHKRQIILFINRRGMSKFSVCASCKNTLKCPKCERALVYDSQGNYRCFHCGYKTDIFITCPNCKGNIFKNIGIGSQAIEKEMKKIFPKAKVKRVDADSMSGKKEEEIIFDDFGKFKIDILVGTQIITKGWDFPNVGLVGVIDADSLLSISDFKTSEKAFQNLVQIIGRTGRTKSLFAGTSIIQTYNPENYIMKAVSKLDFESFFESEISERKTLGYPPFWQIIKIIFKDQNQKKVEKEAKKVYTLIKEGDFAGFSLKISEPQYPLLNKIRGKFINQIVIRLKNKDNKIPKNLEKILKTLGSGWTIDRDPIGIS